MQCVTNNFPLEQAGNSTWWVCPTGTRWLSCLQMKSMNNKLLLCLVEFFCWEKWATVPSTSSREQSVLFSSFGRYMVTSGMDKKLKVYDIRAFKPLKSYFLPSGASCLSLSQRGLLSAATGDIVQVTITSSLRFWNDLLLENDLAHRKWCIRSSALLQVYSCLMEKVVRQWS